MTKKHPEIDKNPFIPARSLVCQMADTLLIFSLALAGVSAALLTTLKHLGVAL